MIIVAELLQSPDSECASDANKALFLLCTASPENVTLLLEQGVASRVRELCDKNETRESSVKVFSSMLRSTTTFHHRILLSDRFRGIITIIISEMINATSDDTRYSIFYYSSHLYYFSNYKLELKYVQHYALSLILIINTYFHILAIS